MIPDNYQTISRFPYTDWDVDAFPHLLGYLNCINELDGPCGIHVQWDGEGIIAITDCRDGCLPDKDQMDALLRLRDIQAQVGQMICLEVDVL